MTVAKETWLTFSRNFLETNKMRLTESTLKRIINEEYDSMLLESSLKSALPPIEIKDLVPKVKKMKATRGEEDLIKEDFGLSAMVITAGVLALPKILQWMGKAAKTFFAQEKVAKFMAKNFSTENEIKIETFVQAITTGLGNLIHSSYLFLIKWSIVKPILLLAKAAGGKSTEKDADELTEILFIMLLAVFCILGVASGAATIASGHIAGHAAALTIESVASTVKAFEMTEYAGMVPAALKFLETAKHH
jgi:hypothetical protein